jgi:hypothetical protein
MDFTNHGVDSRIGYHRVRRDSDRLMESIHQPEIPMFGSTKCGKCERASFKIQEINPGGSAYKFYSIQCSHCQTPIGVTDFYNVGQLLKNQEKAIADLGQKVDYIQSSVGQIVRALQSMGR